MKVAALLFVMGRSEAKKGECIEEDKDREKVHLLSIPWRSDSGMTVNFKRLG